MGDVTPDMRRVSLAEAQDLHGLLTGAALLLHRYSDDPASVAEALADIERAQDISRGIVDQVPDR